MKTEDLGFPLYPVKIVFGVIPRYRPLFVDANGLQRPARYNPPGAP